MTRRTPRKKDGVSATDDEISGLIHLRGAAQGKVTRMKNALLDADQVELTPPQVKMFMKKLEAAYAEFNDVHQRIVEQIPSAQREEHDERYLEFEHLHDEVSLFLETWLENFSTQAPSPAHSAASGNPLVIQQPLPRMIPTFDGTYEQWEKFKIMFRDV